MKSIVIFAAAVVLSGAAAAQSTVSIFGNLDAGFGRYTATGTPSVNTFQYGGYIPDLIGFRGSEDLGGGLGANFWLEAGFDIGTGADPGTAGSGYSNGPGAGGNNGFSFSRRSTVSLSGRWGEIRLGRDFTPDYGNKAVFDPTNVNGVGSSFHLFMFGFTPAMNDLVWASNTVEYLYGFAPNSAPDVGKGGLYVQAMHAFNEHPNSTSGSYNGLRVGYVAGPLNVAVGGASLANAVDGTPMRVLNVGGSYDVGNIAKLIGKFNINRSGDRAVNNKAILIGAQVTLGSGYIPISAIHFDSSGTVSDGFKANQISIGYVYKLSKRTSVYTTYGHVVNSGGASFGVGAVSPSVANGTASGYEFGVQSLF